MSCALYFVRPHPFSTKGTLISRKSIFRRFLEIKALLAEKDAGAQKIMHKT